MAKHNEIGRKGERRAARYLWWHGYSILERNYRYGNHEIDIVARERKTETLVFVEVKTRSKGSYGLPREAVHVGKQRFLRLAAAQYLRYNGEGESRMRFDIVEVYADAGRIVHLKNAF